MGNTAHIIEADIAVVGAGLVGLTAAIAMVKQGKNVVLIDSHTYYSKQWSPTEHQWDARVYALTEETVEWLKWLGIWRYVDIARVESIRAMQLWEPQCNAPLMLRAEDAYLTEMGCILESANLMQACMQTLESLNVQVTVATPLLVEQHAQYAALMLDNQQHVLTKLIVAADGIHSWMRQNMQIGVAFKSFQQTALVANYKAEYDHQGVARQWFLPHETLALLPLPNQIVSMVWAVSTERAHQLLNLPEDLLVQEIETVSHHVTGRLTLCGQVMSFSLNQQIAQTYVAERMVLVGDAAHQVHPMAGQGVNLGFRDVMELSKMTTTLSAMHDIGDYHFLRRYERARKLDVVKMTTLTSGLDALFATSYPWLQRLTGWGMRQISHQAWLKKHLVQAATL
jgi:ubiquinone biosynthesis UbiH/UbiF/VisC/COQ6 family hydroxylase